MLHLTQVAKRSHKEAFPLRLHTYRTPRSLTGPLREEAALGAVFLAPSNRDRPLLLEMLFLPDTVSFPERKPKVWIWDDLYRALAEALGVKPRVQVDPPDHWLLVRHIVHRLRGRCAAELPAGTASPRFLELAGQSIRELLREDVPRAELASALGCGGCAPCAGCDRLGDESGLLCALYGDYIDILEERNLADSAQIPSLGAALLKAFPREGRSWASGLRIRAAGFLSFASGQMEFLHALRAAGADLELWVPDCGDGDFYTAVQQFPEAEIIPCSGEDEDAPSLCVSMAAGDLRLSTDTLARELFLWPSGEGYLAGASGLPFPGWEHIALCAETEELGSLVESFTRYGIPFSLREGATVSDTALWKSALRTLDLAEDGWPSVETADFLSSLLFAPFDFPRRAFGNALPAGRKGWTEFLGTFPPEAGGGAFRRAVDFSDAMLRGGRPEELLAAFARLAPSRAELKRLVERAASHPRLDEKIREISLAVQEAEEKGHSLRELRRDLGDAGSARLSFEEASAFLGQWAETASIWMPSPVSPTVGVHPGTPPSLVRAPVWILPGMTAKRWPGQVRESPLLSDQRKEFLHESLGLGRSHLPLVPEKRSQREALFRRLAACGEQLCILLRPLADDGGRPLPSSPFTDAACASPRPWLRSSGADPLERSLGAILAPEECPVAEGVETRWTSWAPTGAERGRLERIPLPPPKEPVFSLSDLDTYVSCPFRYYCGRVASLDTPPEELHRFDLAGSALHLLWQRVWETRLTTGSPLDFLVNELFDAAMDEKYARLNANRDLRRERKKMLRQALRLARTQQTMEDAGLASERVTQKREYTLPEFTREGVRFKGRCDRVDFLRDGRAAIFDYKSGPSSNYKESLQLAAYGIALAAAGVRTAASAFLCLADGKEKGASLEDAPLVFSSFTTPLAQLESDAEEALERVSESFSTGLFPPLYESKSCRYCAYASLCRRRDFRTAAMEEEDEENGGQ